jgi:hypothetical protein
MSRQRRRRRGFGFNRLLHRPATLGLGCRAVALLLPKLRATSQDYSREGKNRQNRQAMVRKRRMGASFAASGRRFRLLGAHPGRRPDTPLALFQVN